MTIRQRIFKILDVEADDRGFERFVNVFLLVLILANVAAVILETVQALRAAYGPLFDVFERFSVAIFTVEYVLRLWSCTVKPRYAGAARGRLRFAASPLAIVDMLAILPAYLPALLPVDLRVIRTLRLFRLVRTLKIARYSESLAVMGSVFKAKRPDLLITALAGSILLVLASSAMYFIENEAQPQAFSSIPAAMWWGVVTLTTVGYGDIYPSTPLGKVLGAIIGILGIGLFALPAGILATGFAEALQKRGAKKTCPHCGKEIE